MYKYRRGCVTLKKERGCDQANVKPTNQPANQLSGLMASVHDYYLACYVYPLFPRYALDGIKRTFALVMETGRERTRDPHTSLGCTHARACASRTGEKQKSRENRGGGDRRRKRKRHVRTKSSNTRWSRGDVLERDISFLSRARHTKERIKSVLKRPHKPATEKEEDIYICIYINATCAYTKNLAFNSRCI